MTDTILSSATKEVVIGFGRPFVMIGERINPTGRKILAEEMAAGDFSRVERDALAQVEAGAQMLDVNAGIPLADEPAILAKTIQLVPKSPKKRKASSVICSRVHRGRGFSHHNSSNGVTITAPTPSPSHQVHQIDPNAAQSAKPPSASDVTPIVALTVVATIPASRANLKVSCARANASLPPANRFTR